MVASLYCAPLRKSEGKVSGLYVELAQFGFGKGVTPRLQSRVARQAECMLQVRAQVISNGWDARLREMRGLNHRDGQTDWRWEPQPMSEKAEPAIAT